VGRRDTRRKSSGLCEGRSRCRCLQCPFGSRVMQRPKNSGRSCWGERRHSATSTVSSGFTFEKRGEAELTGFSGASQFHSVTGAARKAATPGHALCVPKWEIVLKKSVWRTNLPSTRKNDSTRVIALNQTSSRRSRKLDCFPRFRLADIFNTTRTKRTLTLRKPPPADRL
jgi:hypothetical protein